MDFSSVDFTDAALVDAQQARDLMLIQAFAKQVLNLGRKLRSNRSARYAFHFSAPFDRCDNASRLTI